MPIPKTDGICSFVWSSFPHIDNPFDTLPLEPLPVQYRLSIPGLGQHLSVRTTWNLNIQIAKPINFGQRCSYLNKTRSRHKINTASLSGLSFQKRNLPAFRCHSWLVVWEATFSKGPWQLDKVNPVLLKSYWRQNLHSLSFWGNCKTGPPGFLLYVAADRFPLIWSLQI